MPTFYIPTHIFTLIVFLTAAPPKKGGKKGSKKSGKKVGKKHTKKHTVIYTTHMLIRKKLLKAYS